MLIECDRCRRHYSIRDGQCPFCRHSGAVGRVGAAALSAGVLLGGCDAGKKKQEPPPHVEKHTYATVHGQIKDSAGKPVLNTMLTITSTDDTTGTRAFSRSVPADSSGFYTLDLLPPGGYTLWVQYNRNQGSMELVGEIQKTLVVTAGDDKAIDFTVDVRPFEAAPPYGAPPRRRRLV